MLCFLRREPGPGGAGVPESETGYLEVRPVYVYNEARVRAHVFRCMLSLVCALAPAAVAGSTAVRGRASWGDEAQDGHRCGRGWLGGIQPRHPVEALGHADPEEVVMTGQPNQPFTLLSVATPLQHRAFVLLEVVIPCRVLP